MLISLNWIRDFIELPADVDVNNLAQRLTLTTAEVEDVRRIAVAARGLRVARVQSKTAVRGEQPLWRVELGLGRDGTCSTVTAAPELRIGANVVYAPPGSHVAAFGDIVETKIAGVGSSGMIPPGSALGIPMLPREAMFARSSVPPGEAVAPEIFDDWLIEIDNKSITHRPDLWGHYGFAREIAAIFKLPLKQYPVVEAAELFRDGLPEVPIDIKDPNACRRYCGIVLAGVPTEPAPLWMQFRLGRIGMRPISALVDLTNYVMADLGQPMHAFDGAAVDRIEVAWARDGESLRTLDGAERRLYGTTLAIQSHGKSIALAGVMGGLDTEVTDKTKSLLLESASFDPAAIRKTATRLGLRTDASARFEKSLDPANAQTAIQRFVYLARGIYPDLALESRLSDAYPNPRQEICVSVDPHNVARMLGRAVTAEEAERHLRPLGFAMRTGGDRWEVCVPTYRATGDVSIEADVIEEIARYVGYNSIEPAMPRVAMRRFEINAIHELERKTLDHFTTAQRFCEIQGYLWYDADWLRRLGATSGDCLELANPAADGLHLLRRTLIPGMLSAVTKNRFHFPAFSLIEVGGVFESDGNGNEFRHVGLVSAVRDKNAEVQVLERLKGAVEGWGWHCFGRAVEFAQAMTDPSRPWEHPRRAAEVRFDGRAIGKVSVVQPALRRTMDEHLVAWAVAWCEIRLTGLADLPQLTERLGTIPAYPLVNMDFSFLVPASARFAAVVQRLQSFTHPLLKEIRYQGSYEGKSIVKGKRSITVRTVCGDDTRTLVEDDLSAFRAEFESHLLRTGYEIRG